MKSKILRQIELWQLRELFLDTKCKLNRMYRFNFVMKRQLFIYSASNNLFQITCRKNCVITLV